MTEEVKDKSPTKEELLDIIDDVEVVEPKSEEVPEYTKVEQEALDMGWNPEGVEGKRTLTAEEFVDRKELYDDLHSVKRQNKKLKKDVETITAYQDKVRGDERKKVIDELKAQKVVALDDGDNHRVVEIDEQLKEAQAEPVEKKETLNEDFQEWSDANSWYKDSPDLRDDADTYGEVYWRKNPDLSRSEVYNAVTKYIKKEYPDKFETRSTLTPNPVEPAQGQSGKKGGRKLSAKDMPPGDRSMMKTILRTSKMTEQEYLKEYFDMA